MLSLGYVQPECYRYRCASLASMLKDVIDNTKNGIYDISYAISLFERIERDAEANNCSITKKIAKNILQELYKFRNISTQSVNISKEGPIIGIPVKYLEDIAKELAKDVAKQLEVIFGIKLSETEINNIYNIIVSALIYGRDPLSDLIRELNQDLFNLLDPKNAKFIIIKATCDEMKKKYNLADKACQVDALVNEVDCSNTNECVAKASVKIYLNLNKSICKYNNICAELLDTVRYCNNSECVDLFQHKVDTIKNILDKCKNNCNDIINKVIYCTNDRCIALYEAKADILSFRVFCPQTTGP